jgi:hypothetical protein
MSSASAAEDAGTFLDEVSVETRTLLGLSISSHALESLLPSRWFIRTETQGPAAGANLFVMVADRLLVQDGKGHPLHDQASSRLAVIAVPAATQTAGGLLVIAGYSDRAAGAPGYYNVFKAADIRLERRLESHDMERVDETWHIDAPDGASIRIGLTFARGLPVRSQSKTWAYSAVDPAIRRLYVADQGADVLQSNGAATTRLTALNLEARGGPFQRLFDGSERVISAAYLPWSIRQAFVPVTAGT